MRIETRQLRHACMTELLSGLITGQLNPSDLRSISREIGFAFDHVNRLCQELTGESIGDFYRRIRLERAGKELLSGATVGCASIQAHFASAEGFSKAFRKAHGQSPSQFATTNNDWRINSPNTIHWGDQRITPKLPGGEPFGITFEIRQPLQLFAKEVIGDYSRIPNAWTDLRAEISADQIEKLQWISIYDSDGKVQSNRDLMRASLAYIRDETNQQLPGFKPLTLPGGAFIVTVPLTDSNLHRDAWWFINKTWVPNRNAFTNNLPGFDSYSSFPEPWPSSSVKIYLRMATYTGSSTQDK